MEKATTTMTTSNPTARLNWFRKFLLPPRFADEDKTRAAQFLNAILLAGIILVGARLIVGVLANEEIPLVMSLVVLMATMVILLVVMRKGYVRAASVVLLGLVLAVMVFLAQD